MARYTKPIDLYKAQIARFDRLKPSMRQGHKELAEEGLKDAIAIVSAPGVIGKDRTKLLKRLGHPYGRGASATLSTPTGLKRGAGTPALRREALRGQLPLLPIGMVSGRLRRSMRLRKASGGTQSFSVGSFHGGGGVFQLLRGGTRKQVARGYGRYIRARWRPRNKAFIDHFRAQQKH